MKAGFILLLIFLIASIGLNVFLFLQGRDYYLALNSTRLDPIGKNSYFTEAPQVTHDKPVVVFFGDSRAADWGIPAGISEVTFINRGIGAQTTAQVLERFPSHVLPLKADIIVIQVGINDLKTIPLFPQDKRTIVANCKGNIQKIVDLSIQSGAHVILTTIFPLGQLPLVRRPFWSEDVAVGLKNVNSFIKSLESDQVTIFDTASVLANEMGITRTEYSRDFLHLNEKGYEALNSELDNFLR